MIRNKIPAKSRSKYYRTNTAASNIIGGGSSVSGGGAATGSGSGIPYTVDIDGNYIVGQPTYFPAVGVGEDLISSERVITWDQAVTMAHEHANKEAIDVITLAKISNWDTAYTQSHWHTNKAYLDLINQDLSTGATVLHNIVRASDRLSVRGAYGDAVYWYAIYGNADKGIVVDASTEVRGDLTVTGKGKMSSLSVTGAFNCYELVANKVRSTNGYLYVTDSTPVLEIMYVGYNNKGEAEAKVKIESGRLQEGDYLLLQKFTGNSIVRMTFFCSWAETAENMFVVNKDGLTTEQLRVNLAMNDVLVRVDNANVSDRRTGILLSPYDGGYIDFYRGSGDGINKVVTTSIGNLDHLGIPGVFGNGLHSDNAILRGALVFFTKTIRATELKVDSIADITLSQQLIIIVDKPGETAVNIGLGKPNQTAKIIAKLMPNSSLSFGCRIDGHESKFPGSVINLAFFDGIESVAWAIYFSNIESYEKVISLDLLYIEEFIRPNGGMNGTYYSGWIVTGIVGYN